MEHRILEELKLVREKVDGMDRDLHDLREDFDDTHLSAEERKLMSAALEEEAQGKTVSASELAKLVGL